jgi:hypothetical protein
MKTSKTLIALTLAAAIPLGAAVAGDQYSKDKSGTSAPAFDKLDTNRDGKISQAEASVDTNIVFSSADTNGDGYLDKTEWKSTQEKGSTSPTPQSAPEPTSDPAVPPSTEPASDTEMPKQ